MTVFALKLLALGAMVLDHCAFCFNSLGLLSYDICHVLRCVGRLAFPIYCFLLVNGFDHSSNRERYLSRLMIFALLSQIPYSMTFSISNYLSGLPADGLSFSFIYQWSLFIPLVLIAVLAYMALVKADLSPLWMALALFAAGIELKINGFVLLAQPLNVFYSLAFALAAMAVLDKLLYTDGPLWKGLAWALVLIPLLLVFLPHSDYGVTGFILIMALYLCRQKHWLQMLCIPLWAVLQYVSVDPVFLLCAAASCLPLLLYKGKQGPRMKMAFYAIYPLHLLVLGLLVMIIR